MTATPLVPRTAQRDAYGDRMLEACDRIIAAVQAGADPRPVVDRALALPQPRGEDPAHWLCAALALRAVQAGRCRTTGGAPPPYTPSWGNGDSSQPSTAGRVAS